MNTLPRLLHRLRQHRQQGASAVEFALVAIVFFTLLLGIIEFGRVFYVWNSVQEVTRRAGREAVVRWVDQDATIKSLALFDGTALPAGAEVAAANINIEYLDVNGAVLTTLPSDPSANIAACLGNTPTCIASVRVSISGASYAPMMGLFTFLAIPIPASTVTMPAESMGYHL
ncbi:TadE-like protein [Formivibrio citricus]|uniref:TadE-like protein n=1 Tax=Formivibrio citricus TaxID=83765 RepID=A0A1I4WZY7_9NEIS|nr:TadE family protein [Formivibrio citricus]SFN18716.1 TadE-like protein [Formivibrio citricus]